MTMRSSVSDAARRSQTSMSRATIREVDDDHLMQQIKTADVLNSESPTDFERPQPLGFTCVPMKQQQDQQGGGGAGGGGGGGAGGGGGGGGGNGGGGGWSSSQPKGESSEGCISYGNGQRAHPVMMMMDDRRVRPYGQKEGEGQFYAADGCGQTIYHRRQQDDKDGLYLLTLDDQQQSGGGGGGGAQRRDGGSSGGGQQQKRILSIAHVEKKKQQRKKQSAGGAGGGGGGAGAQAAQTAAGAGGAGGGGSSDQQSQLPDGTKSNYKHEGDTVNTEVRLDKKRIQFFKKSQSSGGGGGGGGAQQLDSSSGSGSSGGGGGKKRQDGELRGYWDNDEQSWWWKADKQITHDADQQITLKSPKIKHDQKKQVFTGDVHIMGNLYVKQGYKPGNDVWLDGQPDPNMNVLEGPVSEAETARQIEANKRRRRVLDAITVDDDGNVNVKGNLTISGNLTVGGVIRARDFVRS